MKKHSSCKKNDSKCIECLPGCECQIQPKDAANFFGRGFPPNKVKLHCECRAPTDGDSWTDRDNGNYYIFKNGSWHLMPCCSSSDCVFTIEASDSPTGATNGAGEDGQGNPPNGVPVPLSCPDTIRFISRGTIYIEVTPGSALVELATNNMFITFCSRSGETNHSRCTSTGTKDRTCHQTGLPCNT